jgi:hypothetical protein
VKQQSRHEHFSIATLHDGTRVSRLILQDYSDDCTLGTATQLVLGPYFTVIGLMMREEVVPVEARSHLSPPPPLLS